jgi:hypothetical protein
MNNLLCPFCQKALDEPSRRLTFRAACPHCHRDLHSCHGCQYYAPGKPNSCMIPGTDPISDRAKNNFCDEFLLSDKPSIANAPSKKRLEDIENELFGD